MYAPYSPSSSSISEIYGVHVPRSFEQFVTQRNIDFEENVYTEMFEKIKEKIFVSGEGDDIDLLDSQRESFEKKYDIHEKKKSIDLLKKQIVELYNKKIENSLLIEERRRLFNNFCTHISSSIQSICDITKDNISDKDSQLKDLLNDRIDWYYQELDIDNLIDKEYDLKSEFYFLKKTIKELSGLHLTICSICMENQVGWFIDPCGHTLCTECKLRTETSMYCHYCREPKHKFNRLYL